MKDILVLRELGQVKALSQPYRIKVLEAFNDESRSAKEISQCLEQPHAKVNYHIKSLEKVGLVSFEGEVSRQGVREKYYKPVAKQFVVDSNILGIDHPEKSKGLVAFQDLATFFYQNLNEDLTDLLDHSIYAPTMTLRDEDADAMMKEIHTIIDKFQKNASTTEGRTYKLATLLLKE